MTNVEVISTFIDGEPVDPKLLTAALADPDGRQSLVDLLALGALISESEAEAIGKTPGSVRKEPPRWLFAAAALVVGLGSFALGMQVGEQDAPDSTTAQQQEPPNPDRVIELREGIEWRNNAGGM